MTTRLAAVLASLLLLLLPVAALAATPPALVEGVDYQRLDTPGTYQPVKKGEIEVVELFAYGCHHCADFAPMLEAWKAKQPNMAASATPRSPTTRPRPPFLPLSA